MVPKRAFEIIVLFSEECYGVYTAQSQLCLLKTNKGSGDKSILLEIISAVGIL